MIHEDTDMIDLFYILIIAFFLTHPNYPWRATSKKLVCFLSQAAVSSMARGKVVMIGEPVFAGEQECVWGSELGDG